MDSTLFTHRVHGDDVRVIERGGRAGLVLEPLQPLRVEHPGERQHLESHPPTKRNLFGFVDHAHAAPADLANDAKIAELTIFLSTFIVVVRSRSGGCRTNVSVSRTPGRTPASSG
jgi:hypothetical protein